MKIFRFNLSVPATTVMASPKTGAQEIRSDHFPYLEKNFSALSICFLLAGNHDLFWNFVKNLPKYQLMHAPIVLPVVAAVHNANLLLSGFIKDPTRTVSEKNGNIVADRNEKKKTADSDSSI